MHKYINRGTFTLTLGICAFIYFLYLEINTQYIKSLSDLTHDSGIYIDHTFRDRTGLKKMGRQYYIRIEGYSNNFQVPANYLSVFNRHQFERNVKPGDKILFSYESNQKNKINSDKRILLTSIKIGGVTYLNKHDVIKIEKKMDDSHSDIILGTLYLVVGLIVFIRDRYKRKKLIPT